MRNNKVTAKNGKSFFHVMSAGLHGEKIPTPFLMAAVDGLDEQNSVILWIGGGCKGFSEEMTRNLLAYFQKGLRGRLKDAVIFSGSTRGDKPMVTDVPEAIRLANPNADIRLLGTAPRVGKMHLVNNGDALNLMLDQYNAANASYDHQLVVQENAADEAWANSANGGWDGDVAIRLQAVKTLKAAGYPVVGLFINGGGITNDEIELSISQGWPTVLVTDGTGRASDVAAVKYANHRRVFVAQFGEGNEGTLTTAANKAGLLR